ncbi:MAG: ABC-F family ATP-binding cassette domain-containing protein [Lachnospiraceae bacterium]|nr:ABC-F family ATP-binding cassette domain-containing protein [Lachnospiraceae bacterium]
MILSCNHISKAYGTEVILNDCSFHLEDNEKAAIIGVNGAGKSTLLKIIVGELPADDGTVTTGKDKTIGYLAQHQNLSSEATIYEEILSVKKDLVDSEKRLRDMESLMNSLEGEELIELTEKYTRLTHDFDIKGGYTYRSEISGIIKGIGFDESVYDKPVNQLSGGQKTRVALGKLLLSKPDIIILDEPTNHLDLNSIKWLETYLSTYPGAVLIVAHDRYFLDKIVTKVIEIDAHKAHVYLGNYSDYSKKKQAMRESMINLYIKQQKEIKHQEEVIEKLRSFKQEKFYKRAQSREIALSKMELIENPDTVESTMSLTLEPNCISGNDVLFVDNLAKSFDNRQLFSDLSFSIKRGERVALIGDNGTGKTTILKILNEIIPADAGSFTLGTNVFIGYYDQEHHTLNDNNTLFEEVSDAYPDLTNTKIRNVLAAFMFTGDDVFKRVGDLSGGEKGRLSLAKLMLSNANFIILDEPTNHLDMVSKEILENALNKYTGTILYVSHDRFFINQTATRIIELTNHKLVNYLGNYDYYEEKRDELTKIYAPEIETAISVQQTSASSGKDDYLQQKEEQARIRKLENSIKKAESRIAELEAQLAAIEEKLSDPAIGTDLGQLSKLTAEQNAINEELETLFEQWEEWSSSL